MYIGLLTKNVDGCIENHTCAAEDVELAVANRMIANHQQILFAATAEDQKLVQQALDAVASMCGIAPPSPTPGLLDLPGEYYVYAYFNNLNAPEWNDCFYIGKGTAQRWTEHVGKRCATNLPEATSGKNRHIDAWVTAQRNAAPSPLTNKKLMTAAKQQGLVRKLGQWAGSYAEACAFAAEHFLIRGVLGVYELTNDTGGNNRIGNLCILVRDKGLDMTMQSHANAWGHAVNTFISNPDGKILNNRIRPGLHLLSYQNLFTCLDQSLAQIGLFPQARNYFDQNAYPGAPAHASVEGAADPCLSYVTNDLRPFRIQLKMSICNDGAYVNVRPRIDNVNGRNNYFQYFQKINICGTPLVDYYGGHSPIRNPETPYFKPFAENGAGNNDTLFNLFTLCPRQTAVNGHANWIKNRQFNHNLREALDLFIRTF